MAIQPTGAASKGQPKDLINLRNLRNGEVYRFSCRTCIDGHRAPSCPPKTHRGKIMYRRPNPGRPARQCGHPKGLQCDCLVQRTLCCVLTSAEWDEVIEGSIVSVQMYDTLEELEAAHVGTVFGSYLAMRAPSASVSNTAYETSSTGRTPPPVTSCGASATGFSPSSTDEARATSVWTDLTTHAAPHTRHHSSSASTTGSVSTIDLQAAPSIAARQPRTLPHGHFSQFQVNVPPSHMSDTSMDLGFAMPHRPINPDDIFQTGATQPPMNAGMLALQRQYSMNMELSQLSPAMQEAYLQSAAQSLPQSAPMMFAAPALVAPVPLGLDISIPRVVTPPARPSQSCCSSKKMKPMAQQTHMFGSYTFPGAAPLTQFPCASCASTLCTCADCPSTMQSFGFDGAWSQSCGRTGHLENPFPSTFSQHQLHQMQPGQQYQQAPPPTRTSLASLQNPIHFATGPAIDSAWTMDMDDPVPNAFISPATSTAPQTINPAAIFSKSQDWQ